MKSYTDLEQSKVLSQILSPESADMTCIGTEFIPYPYCESKFKGEDNVYPTWSLAALLGVLPRETRLLKSATDDIFYHTDCPKGNVDEWFDNPVDACYEMILKLHELKLL